MTMDTNAAGDGAGALLAELRARCPAAMSVRATDIPDLRIHLGRRVLVALSSRADGHLRCGTYATVTACRALGFNAEPESGQMTARFDFRPDRDDIGNLFAVAGAAAAAITD